MSAPKGAERPTPETDALLEQTRANSLEYQLSKLVPHARTLERDRDYWKQAACDADTGRINAEGERDALRERVKEAERGLTLPGMEQDNYVGWCRFHNGRFSACDSDSEGAFKVYRHSDALRPLPSGMRLVPEEASVVMVPREVLYDLVRYGCIHPIEGVRYSSGTHLELLQRASDLLAAAPEAK